MTLLKRIPPIAAAVIWLVVLIAGCTAEGGQPPVDPRPTTPPPITRPVDARAYRDKPCELLSDQQAATREFKPAPDLLNPMDGPRCYWRGTTTGKESILRIWLRSEDQLAQIYRHDTGNETIWADFVPVTIAGQPAARSEPPGSRQPHCAVAVGLTDNQTLEVSQNYGEKPCDQVTAVAEMVMHNLGR